MPDEGVFIDLIVASERVGQWLDVLRSDSSLQRRAQALKALAAHVLKSQAYAEEARVAGAVSVLTACISKTDDLDTLEAASKVIAACSGPLANSGQVRQFQYKTKAGDDLTVNLREGSLSEGVGVRLWLSAHALCRELTACPDIVEGKNVLELGSGCGLCAIVASKLGANMVTLSDCDPATLQNAAANMVANAAGVPSRRISQSGHSRPLLSTDSLAEWEPQARPESPVPRFSSPIRHGSIAGPDWDRAISNIGPPSRFGEAGELTQRASSPIRHGSIITPDWGDRPPSPIRHGSSMSFLQRHESTLDRTSSLRPDSPLMRTSSRGSESPLWRPSVSPRRRTSTHAGAGHSLLRRSSVSSLKMERRMREFDIGQYTLDSMGSGLLSSQVIEEALESGDEAMDGMWPASESQPLQWDGDIDSSVWNSGNMRVCFLDWSHAPNADVSLRQRRGKGIRLSDEDPYHRYMSPRASKDPTEDKFHPLCQDLLSSGVETAPVIDNMELPHEVKTNIQAGLPPVLTGDEKFDVIIGSDLLYEASHASMVAAVIAHRMSALGCAYLALPVREKDIWSAFTSMAMLHGLEIESENFIPEPQDEGLCSENKEYEGGFVLTRLTKTFSNRIASSCRH